MQIEKTFIEDCFIIKPNVFDDVRGTFFESFNQREFAKLTGIEVNFVQDNQSVSRKGVVRGLHFQKGKFAQAKLVRVIQGKILDVVVDLRKQSKTYGQHFSIKLDGKNNYQLYIPEGLAHGFLSLENKTILAYKCNQYYHQAQELGIVYDDPTLNIDWGIPESDIILSTKDKKLPQFAELM